MAGGRRVTQGFRYFALRAVGKPPMKDFKPESAVIHSLLSIDVFDPGAENGQEGGDSEKHRSRFGGFYTGPGQK